MNESKGENIRQCATKDEPNLEIGPMSVSTKDINKPIVDPTYAITWLGTSVDSEKVNFALTSLLFTILEP